MVKSDLEVGSHCNHLNLFFSEDLSTDTQKRTRALLSLAKSKVSK